jgi:hypothetical protein
MKKFLTISGIALFSSFTLAQTPVGEWTDHLNYSSARSVAVGSNEVFASTGSSVIVYNKSFAELRKLSKVTGISETGISTIALSEENSTLIIAYNSTNIDVVKGNAIYNIPDIERKYIPGDKTIYRIRVSGRYAYLACSFGIVVLDLVKNEIYDTWKPGNSSAAASVKDVAFGDGKVFAATNIGVFSADITNSGLAYFGNWSPVKSLPSPGGNYNLALFSGNNLYVNRTGQYFNGDTIYAIHGTSVIFSYSPGVFNSSFDSYDTGFIVSSGSSAKIYNTDGSLSRTISTYGWGSPDIAQAIKDGSDIWISDISIGLVRATNNTDYSLLTLPGPVSNDAINIVSHDGKTIICAGGIDASWNNLGRPLQVSIHEDNSWTDILSTTIIDPMRALVDPSDNTHFFVSTWGGGLLEYRNNILVKKYDDTNSPLKTIISGKPYVRICGLAMDKDRNLWITQNEVIGSIKILKPDGTWIVNPLTIDAHDIGDIIITRSGQKWMILPRGNGIAVFDDNGTPSNFNDDSYIKMLVTDSDNEVINYVYSIAEDLDGNIWVGTDQGPLIYYNPEKVFNGDLKAYRILVPRNDGTGEGDYMLKTETITSISVDGANRKWLGTLNSGAYLLSADGTKELKNYNEDNSPLFSNVISSVAVDTKTGDVWFATSKGIISYRGNAIEGKESFSNVYSFPNPVREDFTRNVTITGLVRNTEIRITDVSGNLVYKTKSMGGMASWDLTTYNGRRVATGVYLVFCSDPQGIQSCVTKILVIH